MKWRKSYVYVKKKTHGIACLLKDVHYVFKRKFAFGIFVKRT